VQRLDKNEKSAKNSVCVFLVFAGTLLNSCGSGSSAGSSTPAPPPPTAQISLPTNAIAVGPLAGTTAAALLTVTLGTQAQWTANSATTWIHLADTSGTTAALGSVVRFTYDANTASTARTGTINFQGTAFNATLTVTQAPVGYIPAVPMLTNTLTTIPIIPNTSPYIPSGTLIPGPATFSVDIAGNIYYIDSSNATLFEWVAATGSKVSYPFPSGLTVNSAVVVDEKRNVFFSSAVTTPDYQVYEWTPGSVQGTLLLSTPFLTFITNGLATDLHGNTYVYGNPNDTTNLAVAKLTNPGPTALTPILTIPHTYGVGGPASLIVDASGRFYAFGTVGGWDVVEADPTSGQITIPIEGLYAYIPGVVEAAVYPSFTSPALDGSGDLYLGVFTYDATGQDLTRTQDYLLQWSPATGEIAVVGSYTFRHTSPSGITNLDLTLGVQQVAGDGLGNVYVENLSGAIRKFTPVFMDTANVSEPATAGNDQLPAVIPSSTPLNAVSDSSWLTITSQTNGVVSFSFTGTTAARTANITVLDQTITVTQNAPAPTATANTFVPIAPCRVADTRIAGPQLAPAATRNFVITGSPCGIPPNAQAYALDVTAVPDSQLGFLTVWAAGSERPLVSTLNSDGRAKSVAAIVPAGTNGAVSLYASDATQVAIDVTGYFVPAGSATNGLAFYPLTPCRLADTRQNENGPYLKGGQSRTIAVQGHDTCPVPVSAQAYSLNLTALPHGQQEPTDLTAWPTGSAKNSLPALLASNGDVTANAAIVRAGAGGNINASASHDTDLVVDINGYFAPPGNKGLSLYTLTPCRMLDTRNSLLSAQVAGFRHVNALRNSCNMPATAQALVINATAVPTGRLDYVTFWTDREAQPLVSTLNSDNAAVTSNMTIVPAKKGAFDLYVSQPTHLILDISSYFAP